jgi:hypothetical protein
MSTDVLTQNSGLVSNASPIDRSIAGPLAYKYLCLPRVVATLAPAEVGRIFSATRDPMTFLPHHALHFTEFCVAYCHNLPNKRTIPGAFPSSSLFAPMPGNFMFSHGCMFGSNVPSLSVHLPSTVSLPLPLSLSLSDDMACSTQQQTPKKTLDHQSKGSSKKRSRANALADPIKIPRVKRPRPCARIDTMELDNNATHEMQETQEEQQEQEQQEQQEPPQISVFKTLVLLMQPCLPV